MKRLIAIGMALALLLSACGAEREAGSEVSTTTPAAESNGEPVEEILPEPVAEEDPVPLAPDPARMMETIQALCGAPRPLGSPAEAEAANYLRERLEAYGYGGELESFGFNITDSTLGERYRQARELTGEAFLAAALPGEHIDGHSQNVIGRQPWEQEKSAILVLSAHYDSTAGSLGVIDNAAGVAVVLEAAYILAQEELPFAVRIVFFGGEEEILIGSRQHLLGMTSEERGRIVGNINVDTLGYMEQEAFAALTSHALPDASIQALLAASPAAGTLLRDSRVSAEFSSQFVGDHMAFSAAGIDSVNFGQSMNGVAEIINTPADTFDNLVPELLPAAARLLADAVRGFDSDR